MPRLLRVTLRALLFLPVVLLTTICVVSALLLQVIVPIARIEE